MHCADCGYNCHEKCMSHVPKNCTKLKIVSENSNSSSNVSRGGGSETSSVAGGMYLVIVFLCQEVEDQRQALAGGMYVSPWD